MITPADRARLIRAAKALVKANEAYAFRGAGHPDDIPIIEQELKDARKKFKRILDELTEPHPSQPPIKR